MSENKKEMVNHPNHYQGNKFEVIDIIEDYNLGFNLGNAIKYILRCEKKHAKTQDLKKAIWYIEREIKNNENKCPVCGKRLENENMQVCKKCEKDIQWGASISEYAEKNKICCIKKCFSCGKEFRSNDARDLICKECYNKYVDECKNDIKKSAEHIEYIVSPVKQQISFTNVGIITESEDYCICPLCGIPMYGNIKDENVLCSECYKIFDVGEKIRNGKSLKNIIDELLNKYELDLFRWHDYRKEKPQKGEYYTRYACLDILSKRIEPKSNWVEYDESGEHLSKANIIKIISWRERKGEK